MADTSPVRYQATGGIASITLARADRRNAVDRAMLSAFAAALEQAEADETVDALIVTGDGRSFCAGWDLDDILALGELDEQALKRAFDDNCRVLSQLSGTRLPTVALINGAVAGFGMSLVARCDFAVAARDATFHLPEAAIGLVPAVVAQDMLKVMGRRTALDWLALADKRDAQAALSAGLIREIVEPSHLSATGQALAERLAAIPRQVFGEVKHLLGELENAPGERWHDLTVSGAVAALQTPVARSLIQRLKAKM